MGKLKRPLRTSIIRGIFWFGVAAVTVTSVTPQSYLPPTEVWDKAQHFLTYAVLGGVGWLGYPGQRQMVLLSIGLLLLGAGLEAAQGIVPGRSPSVGDVIANTVGVLAGLLVSHRIWPPPREVDQHPMERPPS